MNGLNAGKDLTNDIALYGRVVSIILTGSTWNRPFDVWMSGNTLLIYYGNGTYTPPQNEMSCTVRIEFRK